MKKLGLALILVVLAVSACDNKLPPTKAPGAEQSSHASDPVMDTETVSN
ncbi:hypothetical protein ACVILI_003073 [Mesorhizobium sp. USDA 4775]|jgi:hypothetical protein|nr:MULTISPECIES: hypothetical protein [Mesorhizobium]MCH4560403.1 hypothetical protein [Mesorhizobium jarvisii]